jgi:RNA polymerase primary sigma factor
MANMAEKRLVEANLQLVVSRAEHYRHGNIHIVDLVEKGNAGLLLAVQSLAGHFPSSFSEYAIPFIERALAEAKVSELISPAHKQ